MPMYGLRQMVVLSWSENEWQFHGIISMSLKIVEDLSHTPLKNDQQVQCAHCGMIWFKKVKFLISNICIKNLAFKAKNVYVECQPI